MQSVDAIIRSHINDTSMSYEVLKDIKALMQQQCFDRRSAAGQKTEECFRNVMVFGQ